MEERGGKCGSERVASEVKVTQGREVHDGGRNGGDEAVIAETEIGEIGKRTDERWDGASNAIKTEVEKTQGREEAD